VTLDEVVSALAVPGRELRAGGTDVHGEALVDLRGVRELRGVTWRADGGGRLGAMTTIAEVAGDAQVQAAYPALAVAAASLATPQIRAAATVGGNLLQRNRCWYYRNPHFSCYQSGGDGCPARTGVNLHLVVIDQGPCVAPHPSSLATVLLSYDATVTVSGRGTIGLRDLYGDGSDPTSDHALRGGEVLVAVDLPAAVAGERAAYRRVAGRALAEWPLVEAVARLGVSGTTITSAAVAVGGVARTPVRLAEVEDALVGREATESTFEAAALLASTHCAPLAQTAYKVGLLRDTVLDVLYSVADEGSLHRR